MILEDMEHGELVNLVERLMHKIDNLKAEVKDLRSQVSWHGYVDTQGGSFTQDEIDRCRGW